MNVDAITRVKRDVVIANRILAQQNVLDAYGHLSARSDRNPDHFVMTRSRSPAIAEIGDVSEGVWLRYAAH